MNAAHISRKPRRDGARSPAIHSSMVEALESRTLLSESATAQLSLLSTTGTAPNQVFHYDITVNDTGTTNIGTFWFGWLPGEDFLGSVPSAVSNPTGWNNTVTGSGNGVDGSAIEWVATSNSITPGHSLSGFSFSSADSPAVLAANSPDYPGTPAMTTTVYSGAAFSDGGFQLVVAPAATTAASTTTLMTSNASIAAGAPVTFTATVAPASGTGTTPTGTVSFSRDGNSLGSINVQPDGTAALTTSSLPVGADHITATYNGDSNYNSSASAPLTETVAPPVNAVATTTTLISSLPSAASGAAVQFTVAVTPAVSGVAPTGTVSFTQDGNALGDSPVQSDGTATLTTSTLPIGSDSIVATYNGDDNYAVSASAPLAQSITQPATLVPTIAKSKLPTAVVAGVAVRGSVTLDITNQTGAIVKGKATFAIYASTTGGIDNSSILLGQIVKSVKVSTVKPQVVTVNIKSAGLPTGSFTLFARVTDPSAIVNDSTAGPSLAAAAPFIALSETVAKDALPASATGGAKAHGSVMLTITNAGNITTPGTTTLGLFATTDGTVDGSAIQLVTLSKKLHIKPGKSSRASISLKLLPAIAAGPYTLVAQVLDPNGFASSVTIGPIMIS